MTVKELIASLQEMPQDVDVMYVWDGEARSKVQYMWYALSGRVMLCDARENVYTKEDRPSWADDSRDWETPSMEDVE